MNSFPIIEFDPDRGAIVNPRSPRGLRGKIPERGVLCFFMDVVNGLVNNGQLKQAGSLKSEIGPNPLYTLSKDGADVFVLHPGVGAPLAAGFLEEIIALGGRKFIACGSCGVLHQNIHAGHPLIITSAVRDEGTSYHYLPPEREVAANPEAVAVLEQVLRLHGIEYRLTKTWTTDGLYRETPLRRDKRLKEGCEVVEMEAAAFFAVAQFRGVTFGQIVYGGDLVIPEGWDHRGWDGRKDDRQALFWLAVEACLKL
jgi:uridine phosphorylase